MTVRALFSMGINVLGGIYKKLYTVKTRVCTLYQRNVLCKQYRWGGGGGEYKQWNTGIGTGGPQGPGPPYYFQTGGRAPLIIDCYSYYTTLHNTSQL